MRREAFSDFHPAVNLAFFGGVLGVTMFLRHPVYITVSLACGCVYTLYLLGRKRFVKQLLVLIPVLLGMAVLNPLFNHEGVTVLFYLPNDNPVTLEAAAFGLASAGMMGASILWFGCCNAVFTTDKIIYLFGRIIPGLSLLISMTLRFVPRFMEYLKNVMQTQQAMEAPKNPIQTLKQALAAFSATVSWALEQSIVTADSMKSRGYGLTGRTAWSIYRFSRRDRVALAVFGVLCAGAVVPCVMGLTGWEFYPAMTGQLTGPIQLLAYICFGGACLMPLIIDLVEDYRWNLLRSGI